MKRFIFELETLICFFYFYSNYYQNELKVPKDECWYKIDEHNHFNFVQLSSSKEIPFLLNFITKNESYTAQNVDILEVLSITKSNLSY
jgi:hypothetical protein